MSKIKAGIAIYNSATKEVALVSEVSDTVCVVAVKMSVGGKVDIEVVGMNLSDCREATLSEKIAMQQALCRKRLVWDAYRKRLQESHFIPKDGSYVRVSTLGEDIIAGVYKGVDDTGNIRMYCQLHKDGTVGYSQYEIIGPKENYQIQTIGSHARLLLNDALAKAGVQWNNRRRCLERISEDNAQNIANRNYFYITECMEIREVQDAGKDRDRKRIMAGNYFTSREQAEAVRQCFEAVLRLESKAVAPSVRKNRK